MLGTGLGDRRESLQGENRELQTDYSIVPQSVGDTKHETVTLCLRQFQRGVMRPPELVLLACSLPWKPGRVRLQILQSRSSVVDDDLLFRLKEPLFSRCRAAATQAPPSGAAKIPSCSASRSPASIISSSETEITVPPLSRTALSTRKSPSGFRHTQPARDGMRIRPESHFSRVLVECASDRLATGCLYGNHFGALAADPTEFLQFRRRPSTFQSGRRHRRRGREWHQERCHSNCSASS